MTTRLVEFAPGSIWLCSYPVHFLGMIIDARMTVVRLADNRLMLHSPCEIDAELKQALNDLGDVAFIVAPGTFHHLHVASAQAAFPDAETYICPGIERKQPDMHFDWFLGDRPPDDWAGQMDQVLVRGNRWIWEVAFFHRSAKTLILVDLVENITDTTPNVDWMLKLWWKAVFHMWNTPKPAPEYQLGWRDKAAAKKSLRRILDWDFERVILSHGDLIETDAHRILEKAWQNPLMSK